MHRETLHQTSLVIPCQMLVSIFPNEHFCLGHSEYGQVSACCFSGFMCVTSLYCAQVGAGGSRVPSCTDQSFEDNACPFPFSEYG